MNFELELIWNLKGFAYTSALFQQAVRLLHLVSHTKSLLKERVGYWLWFVGDLLLAGCIKMSARDCGLVLCLEGELECCILTTFK